MEETSSYHDLSILLYAYTRQSVDREAAKVHLSLTASDAFNKAISLAILCAMVQYGEYDSRLVREQPR